MLSIGAYFFNHNTKTRITAKTNSTLRMMINGMYDTFLDSTAGTFGGGGGAGIATAGGFIAGGKGALGIGGGAIPGMAGTPNAGGGAPGAPAGGAEPASIARLAASISEPLMILVNSLGPAAGGGACGRAAGGA